MTAPLLAELLHRALPGLRVLDLALATGGLYPWWPEAMIGVGEVAALPPAERALLAGFRAGDRAGDGAGDAALASGAPEAWGGPGPRLVVGPADPASWLGSGPAAMVLTAPGATAGAERIMLILGLGAAVAQHDLLLPPGGLPPGGQEEAGLAATLAALAEAARAMATEDGAARAGWEFGLRLISPRLAALTLFAPAEAQVPVRLERRSLLLHAEAEGRRQRLLLGVLPARWLLLRLSIDGPAPALFHDGAACAATLDGAVLEARIMPSGGVPTVIGLGGAACRLEAVEILPA